MYWHWSPNYNFDMNHQLRGFDETLITYVLAAASPNYAIEKTVYTEAVARSGAIKTSASQYGIPFKIAIITELNGQFVDVLVTLFFLGLDPRGLRDDYVNYGDAVVNHSKIDVSVLCYQS